MAKKKGKKKTAKKTKKKGRRRGNPNHGTPTSSSERLAIQAALTVTRDDIAAELLADKYDHLENKNQRAFLKAFSVVGTIRAAARCADITRQLVGYWRRNDPPFKKLFDDAKEDVGDVLEETAMRRAIEGVSQIKTNRYGDEETEIKYSDTLLMFLLKAMKPEKYRERFDHTSGGEKLGFSEVRNEFNVLVNTPEAAAMFDQLAKQVQAKYVESTATKLPAPKRRLKRVSNNGNGNGKH